MAYAKEYSRKYFEVSDKISIECWAENTRSGFRHQGIVYGLGSPFPKAKLCYSNRTWEAYEFESLLNKIADDAHGISDLDRDIIRTFIKTQEKVEREEVNKRFGMVAVVAGLGELFADTQEEKNDWKARMLKAGIPGLQVPEDWDTLTEDEKEKRLNKVIEFAKDPV